MTSTFPSPWSSDSLRRVTWHGHPAPPADLQVHLSASCSIPQYFAPSDGPVPAPAGATPT